MALTITSVSPDTVFLDGGYEIIIEGTFDAGHTYRVYIGPLGTTADPPCYSGIAGGGNIIPYWTDTKLRCFTPELPYSGSAYDLLVADIGAVTTDDLASSVTVAKKNFHSGVYSVRKVQPPRLYMGPRNIDSEDAV